MQEEVRTDLPTTRETLLDTMAHTDCLVLHLVRWRIGRDETVGDNK